MRKPARLLSAALAFAMAASLLTGCGGTPSSSQSGDTTSSTTAQATAETAGAPDTDSYINCLLDSEPSSLDVAKFADVYSRTVLWNILEPLTRMVDGVVTPAGAEDWTVSDDGLTYTFTLRDNHWSDGEPVTAGDYLYAIQRQTTPDNAWPLATDLYSIAGFEEVFTGEADMSALGVQAPDDKTLVITLDTPDAAFLSNVDLFPFRQDLAVQYGYT